MNINEIEKQIINFMDVNDVPGISVSLVHNNERLK